MREWPTHNVTDRGKVFPRHDQLQLRPHQRFIENYLRLSYSGPRNEQTFEKRIDENELTALPQPDWMGKLSLSLSLQVS